MRWSDGQVTIGADAQLLGRDSRALASEDGASSPRKRERSSGEGGGGSHEGTTGGDGPEERGGAAAAASWRKGAKKADWNEVLNRVHSVGQCTDCEAAANEVAGERCEAHAPPTKSSDGRPPSVWWQQPQSDPGALLRYAEAAAREEQSFQTDEAGWRREWVDVRKEQLRLQGESHGATAERVRAGGPESVEWVTSLFEHQIGILVREAHFAREFAVGYTLLACGGVSALARASREAGASGKGGAVGGDFPQSRLLLSKVLCGRALALTATPPPLYANLGGPIGLVRSDPVWSQLTADARIGLQFTTSALVRARPPRAAPADAHPRRPAPRMPARRCPLLPPQLATRIAERACVSAMRRCYASLLTHTPRARLAMTPHAGDDQRQPRVLRQQPREARLPLARGRARVASGRLGRRASGLRGRHVIGISERGRASSTGRA